MSQKKVKKLKQKSFNIFKKIRAYLDARKKVSG